MSNNKKDWGFEDIPAMAEQLLDYKFSQIQTLEPERKSRFDFMTEEQKQFWIDEHQ